MLVKMWQNRNPHTLLVEMQIIQPLWKAAWRYLKKLETEQPYDPVILLLGLYPKECKTGKQ
jgi:hypothetical protein